MKITLPYPPTANTYYRNFGGRTILSKRGRIYKDTVAKVSFPQIKMLFINDPLVVVIEVWFPDARGRDVDNLQKAPLDALQGCAYTNDRQVRDLRIVDRGIDRSEPRIEVTITPR